MNTLTLSPSLTQEIQSEARAAQKSVEELLAEALQQYRLENQRQKISQEAEWWDHVSLLIAPALGTPTLRIFSPRLERP